METRMLSASVGLWETGLVWLTRYNLWDDHTALRLLSGLLFPKRRWTEPVRHLVIYRVGNIGDTVVAIPAMAELRSAFPNAHITLLTSAGKADLPGAAEVLSAFPGVVNEIVSYYPAEMRSLKGLQQIKARLHAHAPHPPQIDAWVSLPVTMQGIFRGYREVLLARLFGSRRATGFTVLLPEFFKRTYIKHHPLPKTSDWLLTLVQRGLKQWGIEIYGASYIASNRGAHPDLMRPEKRSNVDANAPATMAETQSDTNLLSQSGTTGIARSNSNSLSYFQSPHSAILSQQGIHPDQPILVVNAGAKLAIKRWPDSAFRAVLVQVQQAFPDIQIVLLGNTEEHTLNAEIAHDMGGNIFNLVGQLSLPETWSLIHQANAILSNDTGTMHMAGLLQKPTFTPMSGQYPAPLWHPPGPTIYIFEHPVPCAPCFKAKCPLPQQLCLTEIKPATLGDALCAFFQS